MIPMDILCLLIFVFCIVLFLIDKLPMATTAVLGCVLMVVTGCCNFGTAFNQFASSTVVLLVSIFVVGGAVAETGLAAKIGTKLMQLAKNDERKIMVVSFLAAAVMSMFLSNATVLSIFIPIIMSIGDSDDRIHPMNLIMPIALGSNMGGISSLVGSTQQITAHGLIEEHGYHWGVFDFTPFGCVLMCAGLIYILFIGYPLGKRIWGERKVDSEHLMDAIRKTDAHNEKKIPHVAVIFTLMVFCYITEIIPTAVAAAAAALACIITGCISQDRAVKHINWNIVGRLGGCLGIAKALDYAGSIDLLASITQKLLGDGLSPFVLFAVSVFAVQFISLFISNSTAVLVVLPIVISMAPAMGLNIPSYAMGIAVGSSIGMSCPLSGSTLGITMVAGYKFKDFLKYGLLFDIIGYVLVLTIIPIMFPLTL